MRRWGVHVATGDSVDSARAGHDHDQTPRPMLGGERGRCACQQGLRGSEGGGDWGLVIALPKLEEESEGSSFPIIRNHENDEEEQRVGPDLPADHFENQFVLEGLEPRQQPHAPAGGAAREGAQRDRGIRFEWRRGGWIP